MWDNGPVIKITFMISNEFLIDVNLSINRYGAFLLETPPTSPAPINLLIPDGFWCSMTVKYYLCGDKFIIVFMNSFVLNLKLIMLAYKRKGKMSLTSLTFSKRL